MSETKMSTEAIDEMRAKVEEDQRESAGEAKPKAKDSEDVSVKEAARDGLRWAAKHKNALLPWGALGATLATGAIGAGLDSPENLVPIASGTLLAAGSYAYAHSRTNLLGRIHAATCALCAEVWQVLAASTVGLNDHWGLVLVGGFTALAVPWWVLKTEADPNTEEEIEAGLPLQIEAAKPSTAPEKKEPPPPEDWRARDWRHFVKIGKMPTKEILDFAVGWRARIWQDKPGHWSAVADPPVRKKIASTFDVPDNRVYVDPVVGDTPRVAEVTVITRDILPEGRHWVEPGLDPTTGAFPVMLCADGSIHKFQLWRPKHGAKHALVSGTTGSGKSALMDLIFTEIAYAPFYVPWLIDGGDGSSSPAFTRSPGVQYVATNIRDARKLLRYAVQVMKRRKRSLNHVRWTDPEGNVYIGVNEIDPCPAMPGIALVIDEAHNLLMVDNEIKALLETLAKEGRKVGMSIILATQVPSFEQLGGSTVMRNMLKSGTVIGLRTTESTAANMVSSGRDLPERLDHLPEHFWTDGPSTEGLGYMLTSPRLIRARTLYQAEPHRWANAAKLTPLEAAIADIPVPVLGGDGADTPGEVGEGSTGDQPGDDTALGTVMEAIRGGAGADVISLVKETGLAASAIRAVLREAKDELGV